MTNLSDREQLKEALKKVNKAIDEQDLNSLYAYGEWACPELKLLICVAQSHLLANDELPERKVCSCDERVKYIYCTCQYDTWNDCLDQVTPIVARLKDENEELRQMNNALNKYEGKISQEWADSKLLEIKQLQSQLSHMSKSAVIYEEYIALLVEELDEVVPMANFHGWKSTRFEKGKELREKIKEIHDSIMGEK